MDQLISVIIPAYNSDRYIGDTINSVLAQSWANTEIIVMDDGSTDKTRIVVDSILRQYPDKIRYIYQENKGTAIARNNAVKKAQGDYIAFLDADDIWFPTKLENQMKVLVAQNADLVFSNAHNIDQNGKELKQLYTSEDDMDIHSKDMYLRLILRDFIPFSSILVKRSVFDDIGYFDAQFHSEDFEWLLRVAREHKMNGINSALIQYRVHPMNKSSNFEMRHRNSIDILKKNLDLYPEVTGQLGGKLNRRFSSKYADLGYELFSQYHFEEAREQIMHSIRYAPAVSMSKYVYLLLTFMPAAYIKKLRNVKQRHFMNTN